MRFLGRWMLSFLGFGLLALAVIAGAGLVWGALVFINLKTTPSIPWVLPVLVLFLWLFWQYLGGKGWPGSTREARATLLRANPVSRKAAAWSAVAGLLAIGALAGFWIVMFRLVPMQANVFLPARFTSSRLMIGAIIIGASLLAPITEESSVRGYLQSRLECELKPMAAVLLSSLVFAVAHISQGIAWPKLLFYFLVGVTFGTLAYLNNSILPVIPVHIAGDLIFFLFVWPYDTTRQLLRQTGMDSWFWLHVAQVVVMGSCSVLAFRRLYGIQRASSANSERLLTSRSGRSSAARVAP